MDPSLAVGQVQPMTAVVEAALGPERFVTLLTTLFAVLAFALAAVGLYGVVSYGVSRRLREMGVRLALGAGGGDIRGLVLKQSLFFVAVGLAVGVAVALQVTRLMGNLLFGVSSADPWTYLAASAAFMVVATAAAAIPARRAARVDPIRVLRAE
jgi:ABC-type antimicrobial peptide transport system permease subunit